MKNAIKFRYVRECVKLLLSDEKMSAPKKYEQAPPEYTPEQLSLALDMAIEGKTIKEIVSALCTTERMFHRYKEHDLLFQQTFAGVRREALESQADSLLTITDQETDMHKARIKSDNIKWLLSKRKPEVYGDRVDINVNQTIDIGGALAEAKSRAQIRDVTPSDKLKLSGHTNGDDKPE